MYYIVLYTLNGTGVMTMEIDPVVEFTKVL